MTEIFKHFQKYSTEPQKRAPYVDSRGIPFTMVCPTIESQKVKRAREKQKPLYRYFVEADSRNGYWYVMERNAHATSGAFTISEHISLHKACMECARLEREK